MRRILKSVVKSIVLLSILFILNGPQLALADSFCPAIYPCANGSVLPDFAQGPCGERFAALCAQDKVNELTEDFIGCQEDLDHESFKVKALQQALEQQKKKNKRMKLRLRMNRRSR